MKEEVNHPAHYGGGNNPYEVIKVIDAWALNFNLGNTVKYIARAGKKGRGSFLKDLRKAAWYLNHQIETEEQRERTVGKSDRRPTKRVVRMARPQADGSGKNYLSKKSPSSSSGRTAG